MFVPHIPKKGYMPITHKSKGAKTLVLLNFSYVVPHLLFCYPWISALSLRLYNRDRSTPLFFPTTGHKSHPLRLKQQTTIKKCDRALDPCQTSF